MSNNYKVLGHETLLQLAKTLQNFVYFIKSDLDFVSLILVLF